MDSLGQIKVLTSEEEIVKAELLRFEAFNVPLEDLNISNSLCYLLIKNRDMIPFGLFIKNKLVAGCYVSNTDGYLFIEQLFVKPLFQNTGLRLGRMLLRYVLNSKEKIERAFNCQLEYSAIDPIDGKCSSIYQKEGYTKQELYMVKKI